MNFKRLFILLIAGFALIQHVSAGTIFLKNGDRITGEITRIWDAEITIEPEYSDEFLVDMEDIDYIDAPRDFEIDLADGREVVAQLVGKDDDGNQVLIVDGETIVVPLAQLSELDEIDDYFDWETFMDLNATVDTGNTDAMNTKFNVESTMKVGDHRHIVDLGFAREEQDNVTTKEQDLLRYSWNWLFREPWFLGIVTSYERDPIKELDHRITVAGGPGYDVWNDPRRFLNFQAIAGYQTDKTGGVDEDSAIVGMTSRLRHDFIGDDLSFFSNNGITTTVSGRNNTIFQSRTGVRYEITDLLYFNFEVNIDYQSDVPDDVKETDTTWIVGLGVEL